MAVTVRPATDADRSNLRRAVVALQEYESRLHPTRLPGEEVADAYLAWLLTEADACAGVVLVAEREKDFIGFAAGWVAEQENIAETADSNRFGYVSDICVLAEHRGRRAAGLLLSAMERHFRRSGLGRLRINALAANAAARACYERAGFAPYEVLHEKVLEP